MSQSERQASSRQARKKAGGRQVSVVLPPDAAEALVKLQEARYADTVTECIARALVLAARYC
jgi:hypothetical protein